MTTVIEFQSVTRHFLTPSGETYTPVAGLTFQIRRSSFVSIVGPTGCGKSTLLNMVAGLIPPSDGQVQIFGKPLTGLNRGASYLFQQDGLLPWKSVLENVLLGLDFRGTPREQSIPEARKWLRTVGLSAFEDRYPHQLSGGMRKRCALAQSLIVDPSIVLMDEPFSALDIQTRQLMENELLQIWAEYAKTILFVTHDLEEAIALSDEVLMLSAGPSSTIIGRYSIDLPRPRNVAEARFTPRFMELYEAIWSDLKLEVNKSYERALQG